MNGNTGFNGSGLYRQPVKGLNFTGIGGAAHLQSGLSLFDYNKANAYVGGDADMEMSNWNANLDNSTFSVQDSIPGAEGIWTSRLEKGLGVAKVGLGIYSAMDSAKMNKFMRGYYGKQMKMETANFANNARSTNAELEGREQRRIGSSLGWGVDDPRSQERVSAYMDKWGVDETV